MVLGIYLLLNVNYLVKLLNETTCGCNNHTKNFWEVLLGYDSHLLPQLFLGFLTFLRIPKLNTQRFKVWYKFTSNTNIP